MIVKQKLQEDMQRIEFSQIEVGACFNLEGYVMLKSNRGAVNLETGGIVAVTAGEFVVPVTAHVE